MRRSSQRSPTSSPQKPSTALVQPNTFHWPQPSPREARAQATDIFETTCSLSSIRAAEPYLAGPAVKYGTIWSPIRRETLRAGCRLLKTQRPRIPQPPPTPIFHLHRDHSSSTCAGWSSTLPAGSSSSIVGASILSPTLPRAPKSQGNSTCGWSELARSNSPHHLKILPKAFG